MNFTKQQIQIFCVKYLTSGDHVAAAIEMGCFAPLAKQIGMDLLRQEFVWQEIDNIKIASTYGNNPAYDFEVSPILDNVFFCCTQKTASQWLKAILLDPIVFNKTGLRILSYVKFGNASANNISPPPANHIYSHLYIGHETYLDIPKPNGETRTFYVSRDPRDALLSWYFSAKNSHIPLQPIDYIRQELNSLDFENGLLRLIEILCDLGVYRAQLSWHLANDKGANFKLFRYEDISKNNTLFLTKLFKFLEIDLSENELAALVQQHSFSTLSGGRKPGEIDNNSHYRSGTSDIWKDLPISVVNYFNRHTDNCATKMGYD